MAQFNGKYFRVCETTGLSVCNTAEFFIKINAVFAVICLTVGAIGGVLLALTRWSAIHLLEATWYYRLLTVHGINMLIFWILFFEIAILYFAGSVLLNSRIFSKALAWLAFILMLVGAALTNYIIFIGKGDVLLTSYPPLKADGMFYLGLILHAVGALIGVINFLGTVYIAKRDKTYSGSVPLVVFGAISAGIIAVFTLVHGAIALVPTFFWSIGWLSSIEPGWYRVTWWALGHSAQQVNLCAMVAIWYLMATLTTGARPLNEAVSRSAFVLYILFINLGSTHHLLTDPALGPAWKIWNTSYAMYLAVLASMIHAFTVPASVEVAQRRRGHDKGLFGWIVAAPWRDPRFSSFFLSLLIFGFIGGITGVTIGTNQINIIAHNTLRIPGHFHATVVGGTTLAFMGLTYFVVPLIFKKDFYCKGLVRLQPYLFAIGLVTMSFGMSFAGSYGVPRRHWDVNFSNAPVAASFDSIAHFWLAILGIGGVILFTAVFLYIGLTVAAVFFGRSLKGQKIPTWQTAAADKVTFEMIAKMPEPDSGEHKTSGTMVAVIVFLITFAVYYFANWKALSDVWHVR